MKEHHFFGAGAEFVAGPGTSKRIFAQGWNHAPDVVQSKCGVRNDTRVRVS
jgi:hypothetical protein